MVLSLLFLKISKFSTNFAILYSGYSILRCPVDVGMKQAVSNVLDSLKGYGCSWLTGYAAWQSGYIHLLYENCRKN